MQLTEGSQKILFYETLIAITKGPVANSEYLLIVELPVATSNK